MKLLIPAVLLILLSSAKPRPKYLITITDHRGRTEVIRTSDKRDIDSIFSRRMGNVIPDSLLTTSKFFEIRTQKLTFYCEQK